MATESALPSPLVPPPCQKHAKALQFLEEMTKNCDSKQESVLAEILSRNGNAEYLQRFELDGATDRKTFKAKVPIITYEDLVQDIQRIFNGDRSHIFSSHPISELLTSYVPGLDKGKGLYFLFVRAETKTPGGLMARPVTTSYYKSKQFKNRPFDPYSDITSPNEAILCSDSFQSMYTQMLCGLYVREQVLRIGAIFASSLLKVIRFLQLNWQQLANDIATGELNPKITDPPLLECMSKIMRPNQELADFIRKECCGENWKRIITRIWPNTKYLEVIVTGAMAQYIPTLDYYSGGLPKCSVMYASSECYFGINLKPMSDPSQVSYTIMPNMAYFEFLPHHHHDVSPPTALSSDSPPRLVDLADVEVGKEYEPVITTYPGLCRYRVGDILRVTGFHNSAPQFQFVRRKDVLLSVDVDKTDEVELQSAVDNASNLLKEFNTSVVEYTNNAGLISIPDHYVIYWELFMKDPTKPPTEEVLNQCCLAMEESFNSVYRQIRVAENSIGPLEIRVVKNGTFEELMDFAISRGASISQYKVPRCVSFRPIVVLLDSRVVSVHFSPAAPRWSPEEF